MLSFPGTVLSLKQSTEPTQVHTFFNTSFGGALECERAIFKGVADFYALKCGDNAIFTLAEFQSEAGVANFTRASVDGGLLCMGTTFKGEVVFYNAAVGILTLNDKSHFAQKKLDLRELTFKRFDGNLELAARFGKAQAPDKFSRDPYLQAEKYYQEIGEDHKAREIYYEGHIANRRNAKEQGKWSRGQNVLDWLWKWLTRYGVSLQRLLLIALVFIIVGTVLFQPNYNLDRVKGSITVDNDGNDQPLPRWHDGVAEDLPWQDDLGYWGYKFTYSLDQFLPLVNLHVDEKWVPNDQLIHWWAAIHAIVGWLIVPLLIAALAGIIRK